MIRRYFDVQRANAIVNHDDVRPFVAFDDTAIPMDLAPVVADRRNILLMAQHGGFLFVPKGDDAYELHTFFLKEGRGRELVQAARDAFEWMFCETAARRIYTFVPDDCPHARPPLSFGWRPYFWRGGVAKRSGTTIGAVYWRLDFWDWAASQKRLRTILDVLNEVARKQWDKAEAYAAEWRLWSGDESCQLQQS